MRIRQIILVASVVLIVSSQASACVNHSFSETTYSYLAEQNLPKPPPALQMQAGFFGDLTEPDAILQCVDISCFDNPVLPTGPDSNSLYQLVYGQYKAFGTSATEELPENTMAGVFLTGDASLSSKQPPSLIFSASDTTSSLLQQIFIIGSSLKNMTRPSGFNRQFYGTNDGWQWSNDLNEFHRTVTSVPVPAAIVIGSIGVGLIGWMRISKTYTV